MITSLEIQRHEPLAGGAVFGSVGSYIQITGRAFGEIDPKASCNSGIADIEKAPRNARGNVEYGTDVFILRPSDPSKGNGCILYVVLNRGNKQLFRRIADAESDGNEFLSKADLGNGFPLRRGYTIVWSGWDPTVAVTNGRMALTAPIATENRRTITKVIRDEFAAGVRPRSGDTFKLSYEAAVLDPFKCRLTIRRHQNDTPREIPGNAWEFVDAKTVRLLPAGILPEIGALYEIHYLAQDPPVLGLGLAATRDFVSYLRYNPAGHTMMGRSISHALAIGISQAGRYLRDHISQGFNRDEAGHRVFDGVLAHTAGAGGVFLNERFGQPFRTCSCNEDHDFPEIAFPFSTARLMDPITGQAGSLFRGDGFDPLLIQTNTSTEYWHKGASLLHTDPLGKRDLELPINSRVYLIAGTQHGGKPGLVSHPNEKTVNANNPHDPMPVLRALLVALEEWVVRGRPPPESRIPRLTAQILVPPDAVSFPNVPGVGVPREANRFGPPGDWVYPIPASRFYHPLVCDVDADGNEIAGVRTPDIAVPLGTYTGWNLYKTPFADGIMAGARGSFIAFAATAAERLGVGDPRKSIAERYPKGADYVAKVEGAAAALVRDRLLLPEDATRYVERAKSEKCLKL